MAMSDQELLQRLRKKIVQAVKEGGLTATVFVTTRSNKPAIDVGSFWTIACDLESKLMCLYRINGEVLHFVLQGNLNGLDSFLSKTIVAMGQLTNDRG